MTEHTPEKLERLGLWFREFLSKNREALSQMHGHADRDNPPSRSGLESNEVWAWIHDEVWHGPPEPEPPGHWEVRVTGAMLAPGAWNRWEDVADVFETEGDDLTVCTYHKRFLPCRRCYEDPHEDSWSSDPDAVGAVSDYQQDGRRDG